MKQLIKKLCLQYDRSSVFRFLISYVSVLLIPLFITFIGFELAFNCVQDDIRSADQNMLDHTKTVIDQELDSIRMFALQVSYNDKIRNISDRKTVDADFVFDAEDALSEIFSLPLSSGIALMDSFYVSIFESEYVLAQSSLYKTYMYESYVKKRGMTMEQWKKMCFHDNIRSPYFYSSDKNVQYVFPFSSMLQGDNQGAVVCNISSYELNKLLDFKAEYGEYSVFIYDKNNNLLWSQDDLCIEDRIDFTSHFPSFVKISSKSAKYGLKYTLVVSEYAALKKLYTLKTTIMLLVFCASFLGILLSVIMSLKLGKPLNSLFEAYAKNNGKEKIVSHTIQNLVQLFEDMEAVSGKNELFYPDLLEDNLILSVKAGNIQDTESIIDLIYSENCVNRSLSEDMFALLHGNLSSIIKQFSKPLPQSLTDVTQITDRKAFFDDYKRFCVELCSSLWEKKNKNRRELVNKMISYVELNYSDSSLSLSLFASMFNVSESYVSTVFKEQANTNFQSFLEKIRLQHACALLKETNYVVEDIAEKCGYYTVQSFRRAFKKNQGVSPSEFRAEREWNKTF